MRFFGRYLIGTMSWGLKPCFSASESGRMTPFFIPYLSVRIRTLGRMNIQTLLTGKWYTQRYAEYRKCFKFGPANRSWILPPPTGIAHRRKTYAPSVRAVHKSTKPVRIFFSATRWLGRCAHEIHQPSKAMVSRGRHGPKPQQLHCQICKRKRTVDNVRGM
jgi:hypothetical protein